MHNVYVVFDRGKRTTTKILKNCTVSLVKQSSIIYLFFFFLLEEPSVNEFPCGIKPMSRIVGGEEAIPHSWPWQAEILVKYEDNGEFEFKCGGTLVTPLYVVTAAHCVFQIPFPESYEIRLGKNSHFSKICYLVVVLLFS